MSFLEYMGIVTLLVPFYFLMYLFTLDYTIKVIDWIRDELKDKQQRKYIPLLTLLVCVAVFRVIFEIYKCSV